AAVSALVLATAASAWWLERSARAHRAATGNGPVARAAAPGPAAAYAAAALLVAARGRPLARPAGAGAAAGAAALGLGFVTVLFGALTANLGAASACL